MPVDNYLFYFIIDPKEDNTMIDGKGDSDIPKVVIERLPRYYRYFDWLEAQVEKISSKKLGELMDTSASQVRLDLSYFGGFGRQGYGYNVKRLKKELATILGIHEKKNIIIIGAGNIGRALTRFDAIKEAGFKLKALFDVKPELIGEKINGVKIRHFKELGSYLEKNETSIAILAVPKQEANDVKEVLLAHGVKGILNFSRTDLEVPRGYPIENIHIIDKILALSFIIKVKK
jgi:redox-sensing transcriptional repressor